MAELKSKEGAMGSPQDIVNRANEVQSKAGNLGAGTSMPLPITQELYNQLQDPKVRDEVSDQFQKENPGYVLNLNPQKSHDGTFTLQMFVYTMQSKEDVVRVAKSLGMDNGKQKTTAPAHITDRFYEKVQNPEFKAEVIAELEKNCPGCKFDLSATRSSSFGNKEEYFMQIGVRPLDSVEELSGTLTGMGISERGATSPPLAVSRGLYEKLQDQGTREEMLKKLSEETGLNVQMSFVNRPPNNPLYVQLFAYPPGGFVPSKTENI